MELEVNGTSLTVLQSLSETQMYIVLDICPQYGGSGHKFINANFTGRVSLSWERPLFSLRICNQEDKSLVTKINSYDSYLAYCKERKDDGYISEYEYDQFTAQIACPISDLLDAIQRHSHPYVIQVLEGKLLVEMQRLLS